MDNSIIQQMTETDAGWETALRVLCHAGKKCYHRLIPTLNMSEDRFGKLLPVLAPAFREAINKIKVGGF